MKNIDTKTDMQRLKFNWLQYASPKTFYPFAGKIIPWCAAGAAILIAYGV